MPPETDTTQTSQPSSGQESLPPQAGNEGQGGGSSHTQTPTRPDYVPESLWDQNAAAPKPEFGQTVAEALAAKAAADARAAARPEKPEGYALQLPNTFKPPEGVAIAFDDKDPRVALARQFAHDNMLDQAGFSKLLEIEATRVANETTALKAAVDAEKKKLGANGTARVDEVHSRLKAIVGDEKAGQLMDRMVLASDVEALEQVLRAASSRGAGDFTQTGREQRDTKPTDEEFASWTYHEQREFGRTGKRPDRSAAAA